MQKELTKPKVARPKVVRFSLTSPDGETYHTLADLRAAEAVPLEYLYALHCDGILERWLARQHCTEELEALRALPKEQAREEHLRTLADILYPGAELDIDALVRHWKMAELWREQRGEEVDRQLNFSHAVELYHRGFRDLCQALIDDAWNMPALKEHLLRLEREYLPLIKTMLLDFTFFLVYHSPGSVLLLLASRTFRKVLEEKSYWDSCLEKKRTLVECLELIIYHTVQRLKTLESYSLSVSDSNSYRIDHNHNNDLNNLAYRAYYRQYIPEWCEIMGWPLRPEEERPSFRSFLEPEANATVNTMVYATDASGLLGNAEKEYMLVLPRCYEIRSSGGKKLSLVKESLPVVRDVEITLLQSEQMHYMEVF